MSDCFASKYTRDMYKARDDAWKRLVAEITAAGVYEQVDELFRWFTTPSKTYLESFGEKQKSGVVKVTK